MVQTLKLSEQLLDMGRNYMRLGRDREALQVLGKLATFGDLSAEVSEDVEIHLAEIYLRQGKFRKARRRLDALLLRRPDCAKYHFLMATILDEDEDADVERALYHYRQAAELEPEQSEYLCEYGLCLLEVGETDEGFTYLERAVEWADDPFKYVQQLVLNLMEDGQADRARRVLVSAMFGNSSDRRLKKLWDDLQFREAQSAQQRFSLTCSRQDPKPIILRFQVKKQPKTATFTHAEDGSVLRMDSAETPAPPHREPKANRRRERNMS